MNKPLILAAIGLLFTLPAIGDTLPTSPLATAQDESDPQVVAIYQRQCNQWADQNQFQGDQRNDYLANCVQDMAQVWPVGLEQSAGGEE